MAESDSAGRWRNVMLRGLASRYGIDKVWHRCGSPVEAAMLFALVVVGRETSDFVALYDQGKPVSPEAPADVVDSLSIEPQAQLAAHRVDLLVSLRSRIASDDGTIAARVAHMVVECDGHAFHEKTKEQAARDNQRDQDLQEMGFLVFRFSGSQLYAEPFAHADRVLQALRRELLHTA